MNHSISRLRAIRRIRRNIRKFGFHLYLITGRQSPRYAYTIGLTEHGLPELILAGCATLEPEELSNTMMALVREFIRRGHTDESLKAPEGDFIPTRIHYSWANSLLAGLTDYYGVETSKRALQLWPLSPNIRTIDTPDMTEPLPASRIWNLDDQPWPYPIPQDSFALVDLSVALGSPVTQCTRSDISTWQMWAEDSFALTADDVRLMSLGILLSSDPSLAFITDLRVGECVSRRNPEGEWREGQVTEIRD